MSDKYVDTELADALAAQEEATPDNKLSEGSVTPEMVDAGIKAATDAAHAETWGAGVTAIYTAMHALAPKVDEGVVRHRIDTAIDRITERLATEFKGFWAPEDMVEDIPGMVREEMIAALVSGDEGGGA